MTNLVSLAWPVCVLEGQSQRSWLLAGHWSLTKLTSSVLGYSFWNSGSPGMRLASFLRRPSLFGLGLPALILKQAFEGEALPNYSSKTSSSSLHPIFHVLMLSTSEVSLSSVVCSRDFPCTPETLCHIHWIVGHSVAGVSLC